uniref:Uncharacterized protein n=1 Tax=Cacopsylla melanoneura TaxID=428564 RepID=A0A8D9B6I1_9HEMI
MGARGVGWLGSERGEFLTYLSPESPPIQDEDGDSIRSPSCPNTYDCWPRIIRRATSGDLSPCDSNHLRLSGLRTLLGGTHLILVNTFFATLENRLLVPGVAPPGEGTPGTPGAAITLTEGRPGSDGVRAAPREKVSRS